MYLCVTLRREIIFSLEKESYIPFLMAILAQNAGMTPLHVATLRELPRELLRTRNAI